jgi:hypothetical protein
MESYQTWVGDGLTEALTDVSPSERQTILGKLRRAGLLAGEDSHNQGDLDAHPLVREYFREQLGNERGAAWGECSRRPYDHHRGDLSCSILDSNGPRPAAKNLSNGRPRAEQQKSISLQKRAEATYAAYRGQKAGE